jgi:hypothetical protein
MKRIRMLQTLGSGNGIFEAGKAYMVGTKSGEVHPDNAQKWVSGNLAMEDKSIDSASEKKEKHVKK